MNAVASNAAIATGTRDQGFVHPDFQQGRPAYFDITRRNSLQSNYISTSAREAGAAALAGESEKD